MVVSRLGQLQLDTLQPHSECNQVQQHQWLDLYNHTNEEKEEHGQFAVKLISVKFFSLDKSQLNN